ncbi:peptidylprolyl isomerase [Salipiger sp. IMCC34102]|uniref:peptidylprolyl isomerase n=1 Tax=Salipiger sp. IMCC34102 TaxID=2510647 RepID=UPI00101C7618|nr:peptidylprolyl isomerase [Salipiger sp. IMCC34102]RYH03214.1 peptidylprolyl isomerase [Salipiger sp. IMCC34102]
MRLTTLLTAAVLAFATPAVGQGQFDAAITVNNDVITPYELDQRARMLGLFRTPGNLTELAREQLIEERLKQQELRRQGIGITPEALAGELEQFAARADLSLDQFTQTLAQGGVDFTTLENFVRTGSSWRDYIRLRFSSQADVTDEEVRQAANAATGSADALEILLSEIIIPAPPPRAAQAQAIANQIAEGTSLAGFEAAARQYSALPSRDDGGRLGWLPLSNYPPTLQPLLRGLAVGEITPPIAIPNGIALFQSRGLREVPQPRPIATQVDYAMFMLPAGQGETAARALDARTDTCDDLYGAARGLPEEVLQRQTVAPADIPQDIAIELARLDSNEASWNVLRGNGQTRVYLMLCSRQFAGGAGSDPEAIRDQLRSQRLTGYADALLADLRAAATIRP